MKKYVLGIDIGTSGAKALLVREDGGVEAEAVTEYSMSTPEPLWAEQDPEDWWDAAVESIKKVLSRSAPRSGRGKGRGGKRILPEQVAAVGLTGQMHGLVLLDAKGRVIRPCIMWNDQRSAPQCRQATKRIGGRRILELTGNPLLPGFTAPKIVWVAQNEPARYKRIAKVLLPKDYVRYRLTGEYISEVSDASGTSLFDVGKRRWSGGMLKALNIPRKWLPDVTESVEVSARISGDGAKRTGLMKGTPVAGGAGDQAAQAVGAGVIRDGVCSVTIGTSGVVFAASGKYLREPEGRLHAFCHAVPGMWHLMGVMLSAGGSFRWYRDTLCAAEKTSAMKAGKDAYDIITAAASKVAAGSEGLIFLPYLSGERTPYPDPDARGVFFGLTLRHTKGHMTRAVMEGVTYGLRDSLELIRGLGCRTGEIRVSGGGAQSPLWRRIMADVFGQEVSMVGVTQGAAYGAALLAGVGAGMFGSVKEACKKTIKEIGRSSPGPAAAVYEKYYERYRALYPALKNEFARARVRP